MLSILRGAVLGLALGQLTHGLSIKDRFAVDTDSSDLGGCSWVSENTLNVAINECLYLAQVGIDLVNDYSNKNIPEAARLLDAYFQNKDKNGKHYKLTSNQLSQIKGYFTAVHTWIEKGGKTNDGQVDAGIKPHLFCHDKWLQQGSMSDAARDKDGHEIRKNTREEGGVQVGGEIVKLEDIEEYRQTYQDQLDFVRTGNKNARAAPFWSPLLKQYLFDIAYRPGRGLCSSAEAYGVTQHSTTPSTLTLCPKVFGSDNGRLVAKKVATLRSIVPTPKKKGTGKTGDQTIQTVCPSSGTLFHELFHLVLGAIKTYPDDGEGERYRPVQVIEVGFPVAVQNPDTYLYAAVAYDYTRHSDQNGAGDKVEFYTGFTTQG